MFKLNSKYPIGIDIGNHNIYAAQLKENQRRLVVRGIVHQEFEGSDQGFFTVKDVLVPLLKEVVHGRGFRGKRVVVHFPSQYILSFPLSFQLGKEETLEQAILRQSKEYLTFPLEEAIIDYPSLAPLSAGDGNKYKASIVAIRRDHVKEYLLMLKQAGMNVEVVDFGISSLIRLHSYPHETVQDPVILCNIGYTQSLLSIVTRENILVQRHVPWGVQTLLKNLQANLELSNDKEKAKVLLKKYGLFYEDCLDCIDDVEPDAKTDTDDVKGMYRAIYQIINPQIEELVHELHKIIGYARSEEQDAIFEGIYIYGQGTLIHHLDGYLERRLNIRTRLMNPLSKVALSDDNILPDISEGGSFGLALGLAMRKVTWL